MEKRTNEESQVADHTDLAKVPDRLIGRADERGVFDRSPGGFEDHQTKCSLIILMNSGNFDLRRQRGTRMSRNTHTHAHTHPPNSDPWWSQDSFQLNS